jgi:hypothetical protein
MIWRNMARLRSIPRLLRRFVQVSNRQRALLLEAAGDLLAARLAVLFVPFPQLARSLGELVTSSDPRIVAASAASSPRAVAIARDVSWAVTRAARYVPFSAVCLPQAMAARRMLKRRGVASVMHFGAAKGQVKPLDAHAWLDAAGVEVTGYPVEERLAEIACFV